MLFAQRHVTKSMASLATFRKLALMAAVLAVTTALILASTTDQAQAANGALPNLQLSSASPGELTITWDAPDPAPSDYRIVWAKQNLSFPSYKNANETNRGNEYPGGTETSITLTGLAKGETFRAMARTRYTSGGRNDGPWSGPWTGAATARVKDNPPAAPTELTADPSHDRVTLIWTAPGSGSTVSGYRVVRRTDASNLSAIVRDTGNPSTESTDSTVGAETTYHYAVLALSQDGDGAQSNTLSLTTPSEPADQRKKKNPPPPSRRLTRAAPSEPTNLTFTVGDTELTFAWDAPSSGDPALRYNYEFGPAGGTLVDGNHGTNPTGPQTLKKMDLTNGTEYHFRVRGVNGTTTNEETGPYAETMAIPEGTTAAGVPVIRPANAFRVPGTLTANKGAIVDSDGVPASSAFTWQWVQVDGMTETNITGATAQTYTLAAADVGKTIKVKASFTDDAGNAEGPLTSAAYPSSGSILPVATCAVPTSYPGGAIQIWNSKLVIGDTPFVGPEGFRGYVKGDLTPSDPEIHDQYGELEETKFNANDAEYEIGILVLEDEADSKTKLYITNNPAIPADIHKQFTMYVCSEVSHFHEATIEEQNERYTTWPDSGLDWSNYVDRTLYITWDQAAPVVESLNVTGTTLTLTFSEDLEPAASLANSAFAVKKTTSGGVETTVTLSGTPTISGKTVVLTMSAAPGVTDRVTAIYTKPTLGTANKLVDQFGNETEGFTIRNSSPNLPTASNGMVTTNEDTDHTFSASHFAFSDADDDTLAAVKITGPLTTGRGTLTLDGTAITSANLPKTVTKAKLDDSKLIYSPPANANGTSYASFKFKVNDHTQDSDSEYTMTINVTPVNDPATGRPSITGSSKVRNTLTASTSDIIDVDDLPGSFTYQWKRFTADGITFEANIGTNSRTYTLTDNEEGKKVKVEVSFTDNGGTREGPLLSSAFPSSESLNVGHLGAYWNDNHGGGGNLLRMDSCRITRGFLVIWSGPEEWERSADEWAARITPSNGSRILNRSFRESPGSPGYFEMIGRMRLAGPDSIRIQVRGRFGSTWGTWSPAARLYCFENQRG